jgi:hypothetical protein
MALYIVLKKGYRYILRKQCLLISYSVVKKTLKVLARTQSIVQGFLASRKYQKSLLTGHINILMLVINILEQNFHQHTLNICLTLSDPMSDLVQHYDFPVPDAFLDLQQFPIQFFCHPHAPQLLFILDGKEVGGLFVIILQF